MCCHLKTTVITTWCECSISLCGEKNNTLLSNLNNVQNYKIMAKLFYILKPKMVNYLIENYQHSDNFRIHSLV